MAVFYSDNETLFKRNAQTTQKTYLATEGLNRLLDLLRRHF